MNGHSIMLISIYYVNNQTVLLLTYMHLLPGLGYCQQFGLFLFAKRGLNRDQFNRIYLLLTRW